VKRSIGFICLALLLTTPTRSLSDIGLSTVTNGDVERTPRAFPTEAEAESITVEIRSRMFIPQQVHLHHDRKTVLRFRSYDTELHTVVAKELFLSVKTVSTYRSRILEKMNFKSNADITYYAVKNQLIA